MPHFLALTYQSQPQYCLDRNLAKKTRSCRFVTQRLHREAFAVTRNDAGIDKLTTQGLNVKVVSGDETNVRPFYTTRSTSGKV